MKANTLFKLLLVIFMIYITYQLIMKILGHSWTIEEVILSLIILHMGWSNNMQKQLYKLESKFAEHVGEHKSIDYRLSKIETSISKV